MLACVCLTKSVAAWLCAQLAKPVVLFALPFLSFRARS